MCRHDSETVATSQRKQMDQAAHRSLLLADAVEELSHRLGSGEVGPILARRKHLRALTHAHQRHRLALLLKRFRHARGHTPFVIGHEHHSSDGEPFHVDSIQQRPLNRCERIAMHDLIATVHSLGVRFGVDEVHTLPEADHWRSIGADAVIGLLPALSAAEVTELLATAASPPPAAS